MDSLLIMRHLLLLERAEQSKNLTVACPGRVSTIPILYCVSGPLSQQALFVTGIPPFPGLHTEGCEV